MCTIRNVTMRAVRLNTIQVNTVNKGGTRQDKQVKQQPFTGQEWSPFAWVPLLRRRR